MRGRILAGARCALRDGDESLGLGHGRAMIASLYSALRATAFLTRLPPAARAFAGGPHPLGRDVAAFPVVGLLAAALPAGLLLFLCRLGLDPLAAAAFAVLTLVALTGALHEDGLGDTADGLFGHRDAEAALAIMKDSRIGRASCRERVYGPV